MVAGERRPHVREGVANHFVGWMWCVGAEAGTVNFTVTTCPGKGLWLASTKAIVTLCSPGGSPAMSTVLLSLASAHHQGRSSTVMCRCPMRGDTPSAPAPNACAMRTFSTRYWAQKTPWARPSGSGASTISRGAGSFSMPIYGVAPRISLALGFASCANKVLVANTAPTAAAASVLMRVITSSPLMTAGSRFSEGFAKWSESGAKLGREQLRFLPGREVAAPFGVAEVDEIWEGAAGPSLRGSE